MEKSIQRSMSSIKLYNQRNCSKRRNKKKEKKANELESMSILFFC